MTEPRKLPDGRLAVPVRVEADGVIGDGEIIIDANHPDYDRWLKWLSRNELDNQIRDQPTPLADS